MLGLRLTGPGAGSRKYDLLTALGTWALGADRHTQRRVLRLMTLVTARYNWTADELSVGRREIARLWAVDERTVKREMGALKALGLLSVRRPGARGRVTAYRLEVSAILAMSREAWERVGPDFAERMGATSATDTREDTAPSRVIPFPAAGRAAGEEAAPAEEPHGLSDWSAMRRLLKAEDPAQFSAWFAALVRDGRLGGALLLRAPSSFHASYVSTHLSVPLERAARRAAPDIREVRVLPPAE